MKHKYRDEKKHSFKGRKAINYYLEWKLSKRVYHRMRSELLSSEPGIKIKSLRGSKLDYKNNVVESF